MKSASLLEAGLRRDRQVVTGALATVITVCWLYLLAGAGTGMYPLEISAFKAPIHEVAMQSPEWTSGHALLMLAMWWLMMTAMMLPSAAPMVLLFAASPLWIQTLTRFVEQTPSSQSRYTK